MRSFAILIVELVLVVTSIFLADYLQGSVEFIPSFVVQLPEVDYPREDFWIVLQYFLLVHAVVFLCLRVLYGVWSFENTSRTVEEFYGLAAGFSIASLLLFVTTSVAFDPNFVVGILIVSAFLFLSIHICASMMNGTSPVTAAGSFFRGMFIRVFSVSGVLIVLLAVSPALLAKMFVSDRDVANYITQIRVYFSQEGSRQYTFVNALGDRKFLQPIQVKSDPSDPGRIYVLERSGRLISLDYPNGEDEKVAVDIRDKVGVIESENGALGFAFHPDFGREGSNGVRDVFLYHTSVHDGAQVNRLSRYTLSADFRLPFDSEQSLISLPREPSGFHNGGSIEFGSDRYLYVALGEGVHPKSTRSQSETLRGGVLRIDVDCDVTAGSRPIRRQPAEGFTSNYCIPPDNPFIESADLMDEYWAIGLRNPFRMAFDRASGKLWAGDVGSTKWEEVNIIEAGANYQFPFVEGYETTDFDGPETKLGYEVPPVYTYIHTAYDRAVVGGFVYYGDEFPELEGSYIFADNYSSKIFQMNGDGGRVDNVEHIATANQYAQRGTGSLSQIAGGNVVLTTLGRTAVPTGEVLRMVRASENLETKAVEQVSKEQYSAQEIREIYIANCARCHGATGRGDGPDAPLLGIELPDFSIVDQNSARSEEFLREVIVDGGYALGMSPLMPAWGHLLDDQEIEGLISYIRNFSQH